MVVNGCAAGALFVLHRAVTRRGCCSLSLCKIVARFFFFVARSGAMQRGMNATPRMLSYTESLCYTVPNLLLLHSTQLRNIRSKLVFSAVHNCHESCAAVFGMFYLNVFIL